MNDEYRELDRRPANAARDSLVERLDPALGEASSGIGVLLSELVRRTLRGGVAKIEEEMHDFVGEKVDVAVEKCMPEFQEAATRTAEIKARDIARHEVEAVEQQAREAAARLTQQLTEAQQQSQAALRQAEAESQAAAQRLAEEISATERRAEDKARAMTEEVRTATVAVGQESKATAERLTAELSEAERRAEQRARELVAEHVEKLQQKSKSAYSQVRECLDELGARAAAIQSQIAKEQQARSTALDDLRQSLDAAWRSQVDNLRQQAEQLRSQNQQFAARLAELEKPRGLRGLFAKWFGRKKPAPAEAASEEVPAAS